MNPTPSQTPAAANPRDAPTTLTVAEVMRSGVIFCEPAANAQQIAALREPHSTATAGDLAQQPVIVIRATRPIGEAADAIATHRVNHLVVIDPHTRSPVGIVSPLDIAKALLSYAV